MSDDQLAEWAMKRFDPYGNVSDEQLADWIVQAKQQSAVRVDTSSTPRENETEDKLHGTMGAAGK